MVGLAHWAYLSVYYCSVYFSSPFPVGAPHGSKAAVPEMMVMGHWPQVENKSLLGVPFEESRQSLHKTPTRLILTKAGWKLQICISLPGLRQSLVRGNGVTVIGLHSSGFTLWDPGRHPSSLSTRTPYQKLCRPS